MITKWRTGLQMAPIEKVEVVKETEKQLVVAVKDWRGNRVERRESKESQHSKYHDTWEAAHAFLMDKAQREVDSLRLQLERAKGRIGNIKGMKKPAEEVK